MNLKILSVNITQVYKQQMVLHRVRRHSLRQQRLSRDLAVKGMAECTFNPDKFVAGQV
jgi:hypothetical protein